MLNKNDKKDIFAVLLVLVVILEVLVFTKICNRVELEEIQPNIEDSTIVEPIQEEKEENPGQSEEVSISNSVYHEVVIEQDNEVTEENKYPEIDLEQTYYTVALGEDFVLPEIAALDDAGNSLTVNITYSFKSLESSEFIRSFEFSPNRLGIYKITYYVENSNHYVATKDIYVEVLDLENPIIEGVITQYNSLEDITEYIPVTSGSRIHQSIDFTFRDNDQIAYAEYYNLAVDQTISGDTLEQEAMPSVIPIDLSSIFSLTEEGEYHIRVYDRSGNVEEFVVIIDLTSPIIEVSYSQVASDLVLVTLSADEEMKSLEGWYLSADQKTLTKVYSNCVLEDVTLEDLASNPVLVSLNYVGLTVEVKQNQVTTESRNLNQNDGQIQLVVNGTDSYQITYTLNDGSMMDYTNGDFLVEDGFYQFYITYGDYQEILELSISSMGTSD